MKEYKETYNSFAYKNNSELALYSAEFENCLPKKISTTTAEIIFF